MTTQLQIPDNTPMATPTTDDIEEDAFTHSVPISFETEHQLFKNAILS